MESSFLIILHWQHHNQYKYICETCAIQFWTHPRHCRLLLYTCTSIVKHPKLMHCLQFTISYWTILCLIGFGRGGGGNFHIFFFMLYWVCLTSLFYIICETNRYKVYSLGPCLEEQRHNRSETCVYNKKQWLYKGFLFRFSLFRV